MHSPSDGAEETEESEEEESYGGMEMSVTALSKPKKKVYEVDFECLGASDIEKSMAKEADYLSNMLQVDVSLCNPCTAGTQRGCGLALIRLWTNTDTARMTTPSDQHRVSATSIYGLEQRKANRQVHGRSRRCQGKGRYR